MFMRCSLTFRVDAPESVLSEVGIEGFRPVLGRTPRGEDVPALKYQARFAAPALDVANLFGP